MIFQKGQLVEVVENDELSFMKKGDIGKVIGYNLSDSDFIILDFNFKEKRNESEFKCITSYHIHYSILKPVETK